MYKRLSPISEFEQLTTRADQKSRSNNDNLIEPICNGIDITSSNTKAKRKPNQAGSAKWEAIRALIKNDEVACFKHFEIIKQVGEGSVGHIFLCRLSDTPHYFVLKTMNRVILEKINKAKSIQNEIEILEMLDHPFLPTLYHSFQIGASTVAVMDYCPGGDLYGLQRKQPRNCFSEEDARFYASEIIIALEYLHMLGIVYRDLKPENILIKEDGHIILTDFDLAKRGSFKPTVNKFPHPLRHIFGRRENEDNNIDCPREFVGCFSFTGLLKGFIKLNKVNPPSLPSSEMYPRLNISAVASLPEMQTEPKSVRAMSVVGTYEYLAPEVAEGKRHGSAVDWWALGVLLYELLYGKTPFLGEDDKDTSMNIREKPPPFPELPKVSDAAKDLISKLLTKEPSKRLGFERGASEIKEHHFFDGVNWTLILKGQPPMVPGPYYGQHDDEQDDYYGFD
ncbi:hypothetical protein SUGI_0906890 [Cryptomeria japonica]|nr:hypothetical protein SUGI_0906890 [Cryptomeria japonica]